MAARLATALALLGVATFVVASPGLADDGGQGEVRRAGACTGAPRATWELRLRAEEGRIRVELRIRASAPGTAWRVVLLHERRVVHTVRLAAPPDERSLRVRRTVPDWSGTDAFVARATGPRGALCAGSATI